MGCSLSALSLLYDAINGGGDIWINGNRFRIVRQLGEGGFAFVYLVKEIVSTHDSFDGGVSIKFNNPCHISGRGGAYMIQDILIWNTSMYQEMSYPLRLEPLRMFNFLNLSLLNINPYKVLLLSADDGNYAMKKVLIQNSQQLELVREEIRVASLFSHANLLPLFDYAIISVKATVDQAWMHEAYLLFPVHLDGTLLDNTNIMKSKKEFFSTSVVLEIVRQLCAGLKHMHNFDPPYAHNDVKPGNVLLTHRKGQPPLVILMDFGSARPARKQIHSRSEALQLQEWASENCSAPYRAPELWDCPSHTDIDERTDTWSLGCTLYAIMYGVSPFEYALDESGGSLQLAILNAQVKWPAGPNPPYPEALHHLVTWMLQPHCTARPSIDDIIIHVDKLTTKFCSTN